MDKNTGESNLMVTDVIRKYIMNDEVIAIRESFNVTRKPFYVERQSDFKILGSVQ